MKIRINEQLFDINQNPQHIQTTLELQEIIDDRQITDVSVVRVAFDVMQSAMEQYSIKGEIETSVGMVCSNCLCRVQIDMSYKLDELFVQQDADLSLLCEDDQENCNYIVGQEIDLLPSIRQEILLSLPMKPLCQETCKGLCPECGVNKNLQQCPCNTERIDPRLADLADFFKKD